MVETKGGLDKLAPAERLKRLREREAAQRQTLDEEVKRKKQELDELEKRTKRELDETKEQEEETLEELDEEGQEELEERLERFKRQRDFVPEQDEPALQYQAPPGRGEPPPNLYQSSQFQEAAHGIDYLLNAEPSHERRVEQERSLYQNVRWMQEQLQQGKVDEGYALNRMQEQVQRLKERDIDDFGYVTRIENVLNSIVDYRQQDEAKRQQR